MGRNDCMIVYEVQKAAVTVESYGPGNAVSCLSGPGNTKHFMQTDLTRVRVLFREWLSLNQTLLFLAQLAELFI